jgi:uncharacterized damage-inducible protein DinB
MASLEVWQRGSVEGIPALLQPVAHALLQVAEELELKLVDYPNELLWEKPAGVAPVGFHLKHITGVVDRLFTYARAESLRAEQLSYLSAEESHTGSAKELVQIFHRQVEQALSQLRNTSADSLIDPRGIGRKQIPTTVIGLLFHAAEHCQRHLGQLLVTAKMVQANSTSTM